ncbi:type II secretion system F family protein [Chloroflexota bacterium]
MDFTYLGYTEDRKLVRGTITASTEEVASQILSHSGCRVLSLKPATSFVPSWEKLFPFLYRVKPEAIIMFSRQLALLLESGIDIVNALELLKAQVSNNNLKRVLGEVISDIRSGDRLSVALGKHPESFNPMYCRSLGVGEQTGSLETLLRQMADYLEKEMKAAQGAKNTLKYPVVVGIVAFLVIAVIVTFVLPEFTKLYSQLDVELPLITTLLLTFVDWFAEYGPYLIGATLLFAGLVFLYSKTPEGRLTWDRLALKLPLLGRVSLLTELSHCCRSMALLFRAGLPLPEVMSLVIDSSDNREVSKVLTDVQRDMIKGEGLSKPMAKSPLFLPLMVQMVAVGEETGNLDTTLLAVAQYFETEAEDKMRSLIGLIQPTLTLTIGIVVAFIALSLISAMYSVFGQVT